MTSVLITFPCGAKKIFLSIFQRITFQKNTLQKLKNLALASGVERCIDQLFSGAYTSDTEGKKNILHTTLRDFGVQNLDLPNSKFPHPEQRKIAALSQKILSGTWRGATQKKNKDSRQYRYWRLSPRSCYADLCLEKIQDTYRYKICL